MFDVLLISEWKLDLSFPRTQFQVANYDMFRKDRNKDVDGLLIYVNQDLNCEIASTYDFSTETDIVPLELAVT